MWDFSRKGKGREVVPHQSILSLLISVSAYHLITCNWMLIVKRCWAPETLASDSDCDMYLHVASDAESMSTLESVLGHSDKENHAPAVGVQAVSFPTQTLFES